MPCICCYLQNFSFSKNTTLLNFYSYRLATVNAFLGIVGIVQCGRILAWRSSQKGQTPAEQIKDAKDDVAETAKGVKGDVKSALK